MQRSLSVSRQGTFDTGRAQVDKRGSIRRGDVELPIVDEAPNQQRSDSTRQLSPDKSNSDSGLDSQTAADKHRSSTREHSADKNRSLSSDKSLSNITGAAEVAAASDREGKSDKEDKSSPRYVNHNTLFPETETRYTDSLTKKTRYTNKNTHALQTDTNRYEDTDAHVTYRSKDRYEDLDKHDKHRFESVDESDDNSRKNSLAPGNLSNAEKKKRKVSVGETFNKADVSGSSDPFPVEDNLLSVENVGKDSDKHSVEKSSGNEEKGGLKRAGGAKRVSPSTKVSTDHNNTSVSPRRFIKDENKSQNQRDVLVNTKIKSPVNNENHNKKDRPLRTNAESSVNGTKQADKNHTPRHDTPRSPRADQRESEGTTSHQASGQQLAKQNALSRLKAPTRDEEKTLSATQQKNQEKKASHTPQTHRSNPNNKEKLHKEKSPDLQHTPRNQRKEHSQKSHEPQKPAIDHSLPYVEQNPHVPKKAELQRTPAVHPSPGALTSRDADKPEPVTSPRLSVQPKDPDRGSKSAADLLDGNSKSTAESQHKTEHLKTNIVTGKAWDQKVKTPESITEKQSVVKPDQSKASTSAQSSDKVNPPKTNPTTTNKDKKSQLVSNMALAEGRTHGGDTVAGLTAERDQLLRVERTYKQRILQLEEEVKAVVQQSQELSSENKALRTKLEAYEDKAYGGSLEVKELRREKQELVGMVAKMTGEKQEVDAENERLKARLQEVEGKSKQWDTLYIENNKLKTKQAELERKVQDLEKEKSGLQNSLKTADSKQLEKLEAVQNENKKLQAELINLQTKNDSLERKAERLEAENKDILERLEQKRNELDELMRAMKTETSAEAELKEIHMELEVAQTKISDYKKELDEANQKNQNAEKEKDSVKTALRSKETECKTLKASLDEKESQISELKRQVDAGKRHVKRLEDEMEDSKQVEKDAVNMKARIRSLKNEIEDSLAANQKMKQERTEAKLEADRLTRELAASTESLTEAKRYIKKLETDRAAREKMDEELQARKKHEQELERETFDLNVRNDQLKQKVREMQEDKDELLKTRSSATEVEIVNQKLQDENRKLRQMLVERNMELAHRQGERVSLVNRVDNLERKQNDADIKVQQLKGWVDNIHYVEPPVKPLPPAQPLLALPPVPSHGAPRAAGRGKKKRQQQQQQQNKLNRSWEDMKRMDDPNDSVHTTPSLPVVLDSKYAYNPLPGGSGPPGYYDMYRSKMKLIRERRW